MTAECFATRDRRVRDMRLVDRYTLFILEAVKAWTAPKQKQAETIHHQGYGRFAVDVEMITLKSRMR